MKQNTQSGQALVILLIFITLVMIVITSSVGLMIANTQSGSTISLGDSALSNAESGVEEALVRIRLLVTEDEELAVGWLILCDLAMS